MTLILGKASGWLYYRWVPFKGYWLVWQGREYQGDFPSPLTPGYRETPDMKKKPTPTGNGKEKHRAPMETERFRDLMALVEHMATTAYDDGESRKVGYLTFTTDGPLWVVYVKDPDSRMGFRLTATTLDELVESLQELLDTEAAPWQPDDYLEQKASQKRKK